MSLRAIVDAYIRRFRPQAKRELDFFGEQPTLLLAIENAAMAVNANGKMFHHQRRLGKASLQQARNILVAHANAMEGVKDFDELISLVDALLAPVPGIGELYIYDTSLRIGSKLHMFPEYVYLHRGTRAGARALGKSGKERFLEVNSLPPEFQALEPHEIEDALCIFEDVLRREYASRQ